MLITNSVSCEGCKVKSTEPSVLLLYKSWALNVKTTSLAPSQALSKAESVIVSDILKPEPALVTFTADIVLLETVSVIPTPVPLPLVVTPLVPITIGY